MKLQKVVIIGNGISGITAARHIRKLSDHSITVIGNETEYFFSRTALMYVYMGHMKMEHLQPYEKDFWKKNRIHLMNDLVLKVGTEKKSLHMQSGSKVEYDVLVIACGSIYNTFGWPGQHLSGVQGLYSYQDLQLLEKNTHVFAAGKKEREVRHAVLVGGGLIGVELAEMLHSRNIEVTFLAREEKFWSSVLPKEEAQVISNHLTEHNIDVHYNTQLKAIVGDEHDRVQHIVTDKDEKIECQFVGLTVGVSPHINFLKESGIQLNKGILVNSFLETNIDHVYAIGDCAESVSPKPGRKAIEQVWYTGRMMGETVAQSICGNRTEYLPGNWFNSAKFFDLEYQTYGIVNAKLQENEAQFYWEHSSGKKCVKMIFEKETRVFLGINTIGIRMKHEVMDRWLTEKRSIDYVVAHLARANFDPEFYDKYENEIFKAFKSEHVASA